VPVVGTVKVCNFPEYEKTVVAPSPEPTPVDPDMTSICLNIAAALKHGSESATSEQTLQVRWVELVTRANDASKLELIVEQVHWISSKAKLVW
jgi:hypothetical protein